mmetsp:Transcript_8916/g.14462  ORF Transcript_8916/g.14462 Transcript_8916/m.14462 type:complete len:249 (-) Transcript_8916:4308-5054(-)
MWNIHIQEDKRRKNPVRLLQETFDICRLGTRFVADLRSPEDNSNQADNPQWGQWRWVQHSTFQQDMASNLHFSRRRIGDGTFRDHMLSESVLLEGSSIQGGIGKGQGRVPFELPHHKIYPLDMETLASLFPMLHCACNSVQLRNEYKMTSPWANTSPFRRRWAVSLRNSDNGSQQGMICTPAIQMEKVLPECASAYYRCNSLAYTGEDWLLPSHSSSPLDKVGTAQASISQDWLHYCRIQRDTETSRF